ncbi:MAG: PASTA domain-containing protein [Clostridia bacterium]|nr:PASTA domain-containing protein [Clostridia bacterium]
MGKGPTRSMVRRSTVMLAIFAVALLIWLAGVLVKYQIVDYTFYQAKAISQQTMDATLYANRGTIYSRNYTAMAVSASVEMVCLAPNSIDKEDTALCRTIAKGLAEILEVDEEEVYKKTQKNSFYEVVKRRIESDVADKVRKFIDENDLKGIHLMDDTKRYYPYNSLACHILGYTGTDNVGLDGIESIYNEYLQGTAGKLITAKDAVGEELPYEYETYVEAKNGQNVVLTIDETVQYYLEKHLQAARQEQNCLEGAAGIVINVKTGEILGMASFPNYNPNQYYTITDEMILSSLEGLEGDALKEETTKKRNKIWRNKCIVDTYMPGSTFKVVTLSMALEEKLISAADHFNCGGSISVADRRIHCWKTSGHGMQTLAQAVQNSCNPAFITIGAKVGNDTFYQYFKNFGLTEKTGVDLHGETGGIWFSTFQEVELATASFGQNFKITPLQMITAVAAAANGGNLVTPHVVKEITETQEDGSEKIIKSMQPTVKRQVISKETSSQVANLLEAVVTVGSGKNAYVKGYRVAGKTGTSEKIDEMNITGIEHYIASFVGFAPADDPEYAILVMLDSPSNGQIYGGSIAAPVAGNVLGDILPYLGVQPRYTEKELATLDVALTSYIDQTVDAAGKALEEKGFKYKVVGGGDTVTAQMPEPGTTMPQNGTVILYTGEETPSKNIVVPNLVDYSVAGATNRILQSGLNVRVVGNENLGTDILVVSQSPAAGEIVAKGTVITIRTNSSDGVSAM